MLKGERETQGTVPGLNTLAPKCSVGLAMAISQGHWTLRGHITARHLLSSIDSRIKSITPQEIVETRMRCKCRLTLRKMWAAMTVRMKMRTISKKPASLEGANIATVSSFRAQPKFPTTWISHTIRLLSKELISFRRVSYSGTKISTTL